VFERLIDLILSAGEKLLPVFVVNAWQTAGVLRFGKFHREAGPGIHWKIPFVEDTIEPITCMTTMRLPPQTLTTADGKAIVVAAVVKYRIVNVEAYLTKIYDQHDALGDVTMGAIRAAVREQTFEALITEPPEKKIASSVRRQVKEYGIEVEAVTFTDLASVRSFRLIQASPKDLDN
jgi:membrane protease subunit HflK